ENRRMNRTSREVRHDRSIDDEEVVERLQPQIWIDDGIIVIAHPACAARMMVGDDRLRYEVIYLGYAVQRPGQEFALSPVCEFISMPDRPCRIESVAKQFAVTTGLQVGWVDDQSI